VVRPRVLDFDSVITSVEELLRMTLGEHVELVVTRAGGLWPVLADPGQLEQVLVNLAVNARDAMPDGGTLTIDTGNITVDADMIAGGSKARLGRNVRLRVSDTGVGMTTETVQHVFEPFFTTRRDGGGTGLGLATVYGILLQADGTSGSIQNPGRARRSPSPCRSRQRRPRPSPNPLRTSGRPREKPSWSSRTRRHCAR
jgi:signal transduction histidine kinase